jgi:hypothetical protein
VIIPRLDYLCVMSSLSYVLRSFRVASLTAALACAALAAAPGRTTGIRVTLSDAVDTTDADKRDVFELWVDYLNSGPAEMWQNPEWDEAKSRLWSDFDLTAPFVYASVSDSVLQRYRPTVIGIDREGDRYSIRTLFYGEGLNPPDDTRNAWAIVRVYAQREGGSWKLRNALGVCSENWHRPAIGKITFVSPPSHEFDVALALRSVAYCDSICDIFDFFEWGPFDFYITDNPEEVDRILGLEYHLDGPAPFRAMRSYDILITGHGSEWYPFGLAQMVAWGPGVDPHPMLREGFAAWIGGWNGEDYEEHMAEVASFVAATDTTSFDDYVTRAGNNEIQGIQYFPGAVLCDMVFEARGADGIETLFKSGRTDDDLYAAIEATLNLDPEAFQRAWRQKVLEFQR